MTGNMGTTKNKSDAWYACEASLGKERHVRLNEWKTRRSVCQICITNSLLPLDKSIHHCMIVKDNVKGQVTRRNKQTNRYFFHYRQLNTFDHPYHIHKYLDSEPSTFLLVNRYIIFIKFDKHIQLHMIMIYTGALPGQRPQA